MHDLEVGDVAQRGEIDPFADHGIEAHPLQVGEQADVLERVDVEAIVLAVPLGDEGRIDLVPAVGAELDDLGEELFGEGDPVEELLDAGIDLVVLDLVGALLGFFEPIGEVAEIEELC